MEEILLKRIIKACKANKTYFTRLNEELLSEEERKALMNLKEQNLIKITSSIKRKTGQKQTFILIEKLIPKDEKKHHFYKANLYTN